MRPLLLAAVLSFVPVGARAGDDQVEDWDLAHLLEKTVSSTAHDANTGNAPATVTVFTSEDIALSGAATVPDLLRRVPGMQVVEVSPGNFTVSARGLGGLQDNNVVVMLDGVPVNTVADGSVRWATLPIHMAQLDRIEVIRGPVSTQYGANASAAVVNLITDPADPRRRAGTAIGGRTPGQFSRAFWASGGGQVHDVNWRVAVRGDETRPRGEDPTLDQRGGLGANVTMLFEPTPQLTGSMRVAATLDVRGGENAIISRRVRYVEPTSMAHSSLTWTPSGKGHSLTGTTGYGSRRTWSVDAESDEDAEGPTEAQTAEGRAYADGLVTLVTPGNGRVLLGGGLGAEKVSAPYIVTPVQKYLDWYARAMVEQPIGERLHLEAGYRVDAHVLTGLRSSWRGSVQLAVGRLSHVRVSGGSAFRRPTWVESASRFRDPVDDVILLEGAANLEPQRVTSIEVGLAAQTPSGLSVQPVVFAANFHDLISHDNDVLVFKGFENVESSALVDAVGLEVDARWEKDTAFVPSVSFSALHLATPDDDNQTVAQPGENARFMASASVRGTVKRLRYGASADWMSARQFDTVVGLPAERIEVSLAAMVRLGAELHYQLGRRTPVSFGALVDTNQPSTVQSPLPGAVPLGTRVLLILQVRQ